MHVDYEIRFEESWRVGSGEAAGPFLDSVVRRDGYGLPFVPGTTVRGLVADALRAPRSHPRTSIDRRSGRAADEKLFSLEEASPQLVLAGRAEVDSSLARDHAALWIAALRWIREIGGGRRRGLGGCRIHLRSADLSPC